MPDPGRIGRTLAAATVALAIASTLFGARPVPPGVDAAEVEVAARSILCDCGCHPQSVHDCACGRAEEMWDELAAEVRAGGPGGGPLDGEGVIAKWVAERGEKILVAPEATGFNLVAWLGPLVLLVGAAIALLIVLRRWSGRGRPVPAAGGASAADGAAIDPAYLERIRKNVEDLR